MTTIGIFAMSVWDSLVDTFHYLSNYMGIYTSYIIVFITLLMFLRFIQFVFRRLRFH